MSKVVVVSAHPDDEILGAGGTLLKHISNNDEIYWLIVTNISEYGGFDKQIVITRDKEITRVASEMNFADTINLGYPTMKLSSKYIIEMVPKISSVFKKINPEVIYVMNRSDAHSDHRITFDAVMACTKSFRHPYIKKVLMYECISETEFAPALAENLFIPNYFVDITLYLERKLEIMQIYKSELKDHPFPRSLDNIRALAHFRGASSGVKYAEAFQLLKFIDR